MVVRIPVPKATIRSVGYALTKWRVRLHILHWPYCTSGVVVLCVINVIYLAFNDVHYLESPLL